LKLAGHPQFSGSTKQIETKASATFAEWKLRPNADGLLVSGQVKADLPVHSVLAYADPEVEQTTTARSLPLSLRRTVASRCNYRDPRRIMFARRYISWRSVQTVPPLAPCGQAKPIRCSLVLPADSSYDVSKAMEKLELDRHLSAFREGKLKDAAIAELSVPLQSLIKRLRAPDFCDW